MALQKVAGSTLSQSANSTMPSKSARELLDMFPRILAFCLAILGTAASPKGKHVSVQPGQSIQAAINAAQPGTCITVLSGTYYEQLTISTSGISLVGKGAILKPPTTPISNTCSGLAGPGTEAGICVTGSGIALADFVQEHRKVLSVAKYVADVSIVGFEIHEFTGLNIALVGAQDSHVHGNTLYDGGPYGFLSVGSKNTQASENKVVTTGDLLFIGMCMDDVTPAEYSENYVSGYLIAFCLQTNGGIAKGNTAEKNCVGAFLDPDIKGIVVTQNHINGLDPRCPSSSPDFVSGGIIILGAMDAKVNYNIVENLHVNGTAVGLLIADNSPTELASGNQVEHNIFRNNDADIELFTNATDNVVVQNQCATPSALCT